MSKIEKQLYSTGLAGGSRITLDGSQGHRERNASQMSLTVS